MWLRNAVQRIQKLHYPQKVSRVLVFCRGLPFVTWVAFVIYLLFFFYLIPHRFLGIGGA